METIKVIDLLNKIANGECPKKFKLHLLTDYIYELDDNGNYYNITTGEEFTESINLIFCLNEEVEIIADTLKEDKKIEKLECLNTDYFMKQKKYGALTNEEIVLDIQTLKNYINAIVDKVNGE